MKVPVLARKPSIECGGNLELGTWNRTTLQLCSVVACKNLQTFSNFQTSEKSLLSAAVLETRSLRPFAFGRSTRDPPAFGRLPLRVAVRAARETFAIVTIALLCSATQ
jgi:hypothetical protein